MRAVDAKPGVRVLDCTAGLGRDSLVLAAYGCEVDMIERSGPVAALLRDALARAQNGSVAGIVSRMHLIEADAIGYLQQLEDIPDAIYLDPMFPPRTKHAKVKGEMQMLQRFIGTDEDIQSLISAAMATGSARIILKRPARGPGDALDDWRPSFTLKGRTSRFEVFLREHHRS